MICFSPIYLLIYDSFPYNLRLVSLSTWHSLVSAAKREAEFKEYPQLLKFWKHLEKKFDAYGRVDYLLDDNC
jgi:hypothetical protein